MGEWTVALRTGAGVLQRGDGASSLEQCQKDVPRSGTSSGISWLTRGNGPGDWKWVQIGHHSLTNPWPPSMPWAEVWQGIISPPLHCVPQGESWSPLAHGPRCQGVASIFIPSGGGDPSPLDPLPPSLPWTPSPPSPLRSNSPENQGSRNVFSFGPILSSRAFGAPIAGFFGHSTVSFLPSVADTMSRRPISVFFSTPVQPCPQNMTTL